MIEIEDLHKHFGDVKAVDGVSLTASGGEIFGLLGPNGAGKSTTIGCLSGLLRPTRGRLRVLGADVARERRRARREMGIVPQELALYEELSARENLSFWASAYGMSGPEGASRVDEVLELVALEDRAREPVKRFSGGMKRRLNFACGIVHRPRVLLLDEPTVGVDPQSRVKLLDLVRREVAGGTCVLYTTHYMEEAEQLCDRLAIIDHGRIIASGTLHELRGLLGERDVVRLSGTFEADRLPAVVQPLGDVEIVQVEPEMLRLAMPEASRKLPELFQALARAGCEVREATLTQPSLESLFIKLTGKELRE